MGFFTKPKAEPQFREMSDFAAKTRVTETRRGGRREVRMDFPDRTEDGELVKAPTPAEVRRQRQDAKTAARRAARSGAKAVDGAAVELLRATGFTTGKTKPRQPKPKARPEPLKAGWTRYEEPPRRKKR